MRLSRIIMALTVGLAVVAVPTAAGAAQPQPQPSSSATETDPPQPPPYPPGVARLAVVPPTIILGQKTRLVGSGWKPNELVDITVTSTPFAFQRAAAAAPEPGLTVRADGSGNFNVPYKPEHPGTFTFDALGQESRRTATAVLKVLPPQPKPKPTHHGGLPVTGGSLGTPLAVGGGLVGVGAVLMLLALAWRRRDRFGIGSTH
ncbi:hypothetical protein JNW88_23815 [Micromonospora sp. ATA32]|nr:hypothetical protein [Micromonospora sp. ATA32]